MRSGIVHIFTRLLLLASVAACAHDAAESEAPPVDVKTARSRTATVAAEQLPSLAVAVPAFANTTCPIMGKPVSAELWVDTELGRIYVCCKACNEPVLADVPTAAKTAYPVTRRASNTTCPIMGDAVDANSPTVVRQGIEIPVCCDSCIAEVGKNDQIVLALLADPKLVDLKNTQCPITGEPVAPNAFCVIGDRLVHLSAPECIDAVRKDPAAALEKALGRTK